MYGWCVHTLAASFNRLRVREREREKKMYILIAPMTPENICVPKQTIPIGSEGEFPSDLYLTRGQ